jgi:large subunit ribosomal protein L25
MVEMIKLNAEAREEFGKGAARRIRRAHKIPAVMYVNGGEPKHITLPGHASRLALRQATALLSIQLPDGTEQLALPKQVQRHPVTNNLEHVDLLMVFRGERVTVQIPVIITGEPEGEVLINTERTEITVKGRGHQHSRAHRGLHRGPGRRRPDPRRRRRGCRRCRTRRRCRGPGRQHQRGRLG